MKPQEHTNEELWEAIQDLNKKLAERDALIVKMGESMLVAFEQHELRLDALTIVTQTNKD